MNNYYAPCFYRIDFVVILSYIELPCYSEKMTKEVTVVKKAATQKNVATLKK